MCGIAGRLAPTPVAPERVAGALAALHHRGPDANGRFDGRLGNRAVTLIHTRLSIIDLDSRANQPFEAEDCVLAFNGEIYNYVELREELEALGRTFRTSSDTEVVVQAYRQHGTACFRRFEGMWALALLDKRNGVLVLSRDPFGEKPLFYWMKDGALLFASEVKALAALAGEPPPVNREQLLRYLAYDYKALYKKPGSYFSGISEFSAGCFAKVTDPGAVVERRYWALAYRPTEMSFEEALDGVRERLFESVRLRLRADVPLAFCLSGGIDSTLLVAIAAKRHNKRVHTFSIIDKDERYDESENITTMVEHLGCDHVSIHPGTNGFFPRMRQLVAAHDAPVATISYYVHSFLSEAIAERGFKIAVSGTAADELFTGYYDHYSFWLASMHGQPGFDRLVQEWRDSYGRHVLNPVLQDPLVFVKEPDRRDHIRLDSEVFRNLLVDDLQEPFEETVYAADPLRSRMMNELFHEAVPVILKEDDLNSMAFSIENRSPYLDRTLAEFAFSIPSRHLIKDGYVKWVLRAAGEGLVPDSVRLDKRKRGFNASIKTLVDCTNPDTRDDLLADGPLFDLVRRDAVAEFLDADLSTNSASKFLFRLISTKLFLESDVAAAGWA
jgi:asparagine synthase (glutamine-hydrolysing)